MNMNNYKSISYTTSNETELPEVTIEYERTFFQWLFRMNATTQTFVNVGRNFWYFKYSGRRAVVSKELEICNVIELCQEQTRNSNA